MTTYDVLFSSILEAIHILFELTEVMLDNVVEELFHTGVHDTQTIVFYLLIAIGLGLCYYLSHIFIRLFHILVETCSSCKIHTQLYWQETSMIQKILWACGAILLLIITLMSFGLM